MTTTTGTWRDDVPTTVLQLMAGLSVLDVDGSVGTIVAVSYTGDVCVWWWHGSAYGPMRVGDQLGIRVDAPGHPVWCSGGDLRMNLDHVPTFGYAVTVVLNPQQAGQGWPDGQKHPMILEARWRKGKTTDADRVAMAHYLQDVRGATRLEVTP